MAYNPPDTRDDIRDTLGFMQISYKYEKLNTNKGHVFSFEIEDGAGCISIYSPSFISCQFPGKKKERYNSCYEAKLAILHNYRHTI